MLDSDDNEDEVSRRSEGILEQHIEQKSQKGPTGHRFYSTRNNNREGYGGNRRNGRGGCFHPVELQPTSLQ